MTVTYWTNFSKRKNSTKTPTSGTDVTVRLKDNCSIINPVIESATMPANANYIYISEWQRYYFITNVVYVSKTTKEFSCEVDVLASFKSAIGSTSARIAFASTGYDKNIVDPRAVIKSTKLKYEKSAATELDATGCYVITVYNNTTSGGNGMATSYVLNHANLVNFKAFIGDSTVYAALKTYFVGEPLNSIYGAIWVPFAYSTAPGAGVNNVYIGEDDATSHGFSVTAYELSGTGILQGTEITLEIPYRYNDFRDISPYSTAQLYLPGAGKVDINLADWLDTVNMKITYTMEYATGDLTYYLRDINNNLIQTVSCNVASQCPLGQITNNGGGLLSSTGGAVASLGGLTVGALTGNATMAGAGALGLLTGAASVAASANTHSPSLKGNLGGRTSTQIRNVIITVYDVDTEDVDSASYIAQKGRPVAVTHAISNHSGYVECDNASVANIGTALEKDRINQYLNTGFFYE